MHIIKHLFHIDAPRSKVFDALNTIDGLANWWTTETTGNTEVDNVIQFSFGPHGVQEMKVTQVEKDVLIEWENVQGHEWNGNKFRFELDDNDGKTRVRFSHSGFEEADDFYAICSFSWGRYLESLRQYCQTGVGQPFGSETFA